jgi:PadR family transcriptional regulator PadR
MEAKTLNGTVGGALPDVQCRLWRGGLMAREDLQLLQGTLDVLVLKSVSREPRHGCEIARWIRTTTDAELQVEDRALYVSLHRMEERGWLEAEWGATENKRTAKYYQLTPEGRRQLAAKTKTWSRYATAVFKILQTA